MKKLFPFWAIVLLVPLAAGSAFAQAQYLVDGANPLALALDTGTCQTVTIVLDPGGVINTPLVQAGFWLAYKPTQVSIGEVVIYDWDHGGPWDPGFFLLPPPPDPLSGTYFIAVGNFDTVPVDAPIPICDIEFCCEGPGQSQLTISTIPGFDTVLGDDQTVWDPQITNGIIDLWQFAPACTCVLTGPVSIPSDGFNPVTEQYTASPGPDCEDPSAYIWSDDCTLADIDQTGLLYVIPTIVSEDCTICVVDMANTDINTGDPIECCLSIEIFDNW